MNILPTYNIEAEQSILGAILLDPDSLLIASDILDSQDFYRESHRIIYDALLDLYQLGEPVEVVSLTERLKVKGEIEKIGGLSYLSTLVGIIPTSSAIRYHAKIVKDKSTLRRIQRYAIELIEKTKNGVDNLKDFFGDMEREVIEISQTVREKKSPYITTILAELKNSWQGEDKDIRTYIPTDNKLSLAIPGFYPGHLWMIGGYTSVGKSTFLAQLITDVCDNEGAKVLIFSTEDSRKDKTIKLLANVSNVSQRRLFTGNIKGFEERISFAEGVLRSWGLIIYDDVYSVDELRLKVKKHKMQDSIDIVCLDFIQNLQGQGTLYERMSDAIIRLQAMAKELQVTVIVLSQVSNEAMREGTEIIGLKGAGELAAVADIVLWLKRQKGEGNEYNLDCEIRKNRPFGETGIIPLRFSNFWTRIEKREVNIDENNR